MKAVMAGPADTSLSVGDLLRVEDALGAAVAAFESMGAQVRVGDGRENLVRKTEKGVEVEAEGLPNLIHELVHALVQGRLDDDHGFPYEQIPLDMGRSDHRDQLFEELCCCAASCAFVEPAERDPWFAEQVEILPVFYGLEGRMGQWVALVERTCVAEAAQFEAMRERALEGLRRALEAGARRAGLDPERCVPGHWWSFEELWSAYRRADFGSKTT